MNSSKNWPALTGAGFVILVIANAIVVGQPKEADDSPAQIVSWYADHGTQIGIGMVMTVLAVLLLIFFGSYLRRLLVAAGDDFLPLVSFAGLVIVGVAASFDAGLQFAISEASDKIPAASVQTLQAFWDNDFLPFVLGIMAFQWATGLAVLRTRVLPVWLGWLLIVFGIVSPTPVGFAAFIATALWIGGVSIWLTLRSTAADTSAPATPAAA